MQIAFWADGAWCGKQATKNQTASSGLRKKGNGRTRPIRESETTCVRRLREGSPAPRRKIAPKPGGPAARAKHGDQRRRRATNREGKEQPDTKSMKNFARTLLTAGKSATIFRKEAVSEFYHENALPGAPIGRESRKNCWPLRPFNPAGSRPGRQAGRGADPFFRECDGAPDHRIRNGCEPLFEAFRRKGWRRFQRRASLA